MDPKKTLRQLRERQRNIEQHYVKIDQKNYSEQPDEAEYRLLKEAKRLDTSEQHNPYNSYHRTPSEDDDENALNNSNVYSMNPQHTGLFDKQTYIFIFIFMLICILSITAYVLYSYGIIEPVSNMIPINNLQYSRYTI